MSRPLELTTASAEETRALGEAVAPLLGAGDVVSLSGDLGAGKTTFVQGAARGLKVEQRVVSPTFTLIREYEGVYPVFHMDVYRLDKLDEVVELGFDEILDRGGVLFVEWGDVIEALLPDAYLEILLSLPPAGETRRILVSGQGRTWAARWERLADATSRWKTG